jgi:Icc-related predicted phosphoesterase
MRILHCTDMHAHEAWFDWVVDHAADYDLVCLTGDLLDLLDLEHIERQLFMIRTALERVTTRLAICSGNNDSFSGPGVPASLLHAAWLSELRHPGLHVDGDVFVMGGLQFHCIGWNAPLPAAAGDEIWLYHAPPSRSPLAIGPSGDNVGDEMLDEICRADQGPALALTGHQHTPRHWLWLLGRTWTLNPGRGHDPHVPNHIVIDTSRRTVTFHRSGEPAVRVPLGYPA